MSDAQDVWHAADLLDEFDERDKLGRFTSALRRLSLRLKKDGEAPPSKYRVAWVVRYQHDEEWWDAKEDTPGAILILVPRGVE